MTLDELVAQTHALTAQHYMEAAKHYEAKAGFEADASRIGVEKADLERQTAALMLNRIKNANRPSIIMGASITSEERGGKTVYVASYGGLSVTGDSPEIAFHNFDQLWCQGDDRD